LIGYTLRLSAMGVLNLTFNK